MLLHFAFWTPIANFLCFEFWILITNFLLFAFWVPIVNFLILLYFAFWNFGFQFTSIQTLALNGYEPGMNIHCLIGNLKAGTSCLGVKCCPLIGHLGTVKGNGLMQCGQGWVRRAFAVQTRDSPRAGENEYHPVCCNGPGAYLLVYPSLLLSTSVWVVGGWWWVWHCWDHGCSGGSGGFDQGEGRTRSMEPCTTFRFFEAELPGSSGVQHSLYSKVLPGKEYPQDCKSNWSRTGWGCIWCSVKSMFSVAICKVNEIINFFCFIGWTNIRP